MVVRSGWLRLCAAGAMAFAPMLAHAQSASEFKLPPASASAKPDLQGPVDPQNPAMTAPRAQETLRPPPALTEKLAPLPAPRIVPRPVVPRAAPPARTEAPARETSLRANRQQNPVAASPARSLPTASAAPAPPVGFPSFSASPAPSATSVSPPALEPAEAWSRYAIGGGALALLALVAGLIGWWLRRSPAERAPDVAFERPVPTPTAAPEPSPPASLPPQTPPAAPPEPRPAPAPVAAETAETGLVLSLEATRMNASLVATTLNYRLRLTNHTGSLLWALAIEGDMIAAQAGIEPERQLAMAGQPLEPRHALPSLAAGESVEFSGAISLPLSQIKPIRAGTQALFIPLARFRVVARNDGPYPLAVVRTFIVGEEPVSEGAQLRPFRLDLGPRTYSRVAQRALA